MTNIKSVKLTIMVVITMRTTIIAMVVVTAVMVVTIETKTAVTNK